MTMTMVTIDAAGKTVARASSYSVTGSLWVPLGPK
jgi:hypothetical protein